MRMSRLSRIEFIENSTEHLHPSEFWCEVFIGEHLSIDSEYQFIKDEDYHRIGFLVDKTG